MSERSPGEIEAAAVEINFCFQKIGCRRDVAEKYWRHLPETSWEKTSTREKAARILAAADAVRAKQNPMCECWPSREPEPRPTLPDEPWLQTLHPVGGEND